MSLSLSGIIVDSTDCLSFYWQDTTGVYTDSNTGGFNSPNPTVAAATGASLFLVGADGTEYTFSTADNFYPLMPNTSGSKFQVTNVMVGLGSTVALTDWITPITYTVLVGSDTYTYSTYVLIGCQSRCCIAAMLAAVDFSAKCDACDNKQLQLYLKANAMLESIYAALACSLPNKAAAILTSLTDLCNASGCGCGCN